MQHWPQLLVLANLASVFAAHCALAGKQRGTFDPRLNLIDACLTLSTLWFGGFFAAIGWGQP